MGNNPVQIVRSRNDGGGAMNMTNGVISRQRRVLGCTLFMTVLILSTMVFFFFLPLRRQYRGVKAEIARVKRDLFAYRRDPAGQPLRVQLGRGMARYEQLQRERVCLQARVDTFRAGSPLTQALSSDEEGRIDFKVALFDARQRLQQRASNREVSLPPDLGMEETIGADEHAETRLWQLAAIVKLVEQSIDLGIPIIEKIEPLRPVSYPVSEDEDVVVHEFPVRVIMSCPFEMLLAFIDDLLKEGHFFALRRFRAERRDKVGSAYLTVDAVCGGALLRRSNGDVEFTEGDKQ